MSLDLANIRLVSAFLQHTEIKFDMVSAVDELAAQVGAALAALAALCHACRAYVQVPVVG